ncbi:MAG: TetR family transcriptional regulator [Deltaproteobacteria bacterium]|nr:TetR family transcriptional regulator [Deltaproteobacteria bacterium]
MNDENSEPDEPPPHPRRMPQQLRSRELVRAIREAGLLLLGEEGPEALNTNRIAERAGVGIASLYRYYPNKDAVLADIFEARIEEIDEEYREILARPDFQRKSLREKLRQMVEVPVMISRELLALHQKFFRAHHRHFEISYRRGPEGEPSWVEWSERWWRDTLAIHRDELRVGNVDLAALIVLSGLRGAIDNAVARYPEYFDEPEFVDEMVDMAKRYLLK